MIWYQSIRKILIGLIASARRRIIDIKNLFAMNLISSMDPTRHLNPTSAHRSGGRTCKKKTQLTYITSKRVDKHTDKHIKPSAQREKHMQSEGKSTPKSTKLKHACSLPRHMPQRQLLVRLRILVKVEPAHRSCVTSAFVLVCRAGGRGLDVCSGVVFHADVVKACERIKLGQKRKKTGQRTRETRPVDIPHSVVRHQKTLLPSHKYTPSVLSLPQM